MKVRVNVAGKVCKKRLHAVRSPLLNKTHSNVPFHAYCLADVVALTCLSDFNMVLAR